jgi:hypothetical protein
MVRRRTILLLRLFLCALLCWPDVNSIGFSGGVGRGWMRTWFIGGAVRERTTTCCSGNVRIAYDAVVSDGKGLTLR